MRFEALLIRAVAPAHLAEAIIGDLCERRNSLAQTVGGARARSICRAEAMCSLLPLLMHRASRSIAGDWSVALPLATIICALCVVAIPLWGHIGMGGEIYHVMRLFIIGLVLGCVRRASTLSCGFLLLLIAISDSVIDARGFSPGWRVISDWKLYEGLLVDAASMAVALAGLRFARSIRSTPTST